MESVFAKIVTCAEKIGIPSECVNETVYLGHADRFINVTFHLMPVFFGDDEPLTDEYIAEIDLYIPPEENYRAEQKAFRLALEAEGFYEVEIDDQMYDVESEKRRIIFSASITVMREGD